MIRLRATCGNTLRSIRLLLLVVAASLVMALAACGIMPQATPADSAPPEPQVDNAVQEEAPAVEEAQPDEAEAPAPIEGAVNINCTETNPHPVGQSIAAEYGVTYEEVMTWFCSGDTFDDILLALETKELTGVSVEELLERNREVGWDQVWEDLGVTL